MKDNFLGLLLVLFIGLKLGGIIAWSWVWVLSPIWLPWLAVLIFFTIVLTYVNVKERYL